MKYNITILQLAPKLFTVKIDGVGIVIKAEQFTKKVEQRLNYFSYKDTDFGKAYKNKDFSVTLKLLDGYRLDYKTKKIPFEFDEKEMMWVGQYDDFLITETTLEVFRYKLINLIDSLDCQLRLNN